MAGYIYFQFIKPRLRSPAGDILKRLIAEYSG
jgi:hypothetical protein